MVITLTLFAGFILVLDQLTKEMINHTLPVYKSLEVIPGFFALTHIRNTGAAFGLLAGEPTRTRTLFFLAVSLLALGVIFSLFTRIASDRPWVTAALAMIVGGVLGNLIDRLRFGGVVDFLDFHVGTIHWPAFNVADSAISIGVGILCFYVAFKKI